MNRLVYLSVLSETPNEFLNGNEILICRKDAHSKIQFVVSDNTDKYVIFLDTKFWLVYLF